MPKLARAEGKSEASESGGCPSGGRGEHRAKAGRERQQSRLSPCRRRSAGYGRAWEARSEDRHREISPR